MISTQSNVWLYSCIKVEPLTYVLNRLFFYRVVLRFSQRISSDTFPWQHCSLLQVTATDIGDLINDVAPITTGSASTFLASSLRLPRLGATFCCKLFVWDGQTITILLFRWKYPNCWTLSFCLMVTFCTRFRLIFCLTVCRYLIYIAYNDSGAVRELVRIT